MISKRWILGATATQEEWDAVEKILAVYGWMSLNKELTRLLVAEEDGKIIAFNILQLTPQVGPLWVNAKNRGSGLAEELSDEMLDYLVTAKARGWFVIADSPHVAKICKERGMMELDSPIFITG